MFTNIANSKWLKIVLFITTFAFVGTGFVALIFYKLSGQISGAAQVNGEEITVQEFYYEVSRIESQYQNQGVDISPLKKLIYTQVLENLINRELLYQFAKEEGIQATQEEVKRVILDIPAFQKDGKFDKNLFLAYLNSVNISPQLFELILKKQLSSQHVLDLLKSGVYITDYEIKTVIEKKLSKLNGKIAIITPDISVSQKEIEDYYNKNKDKFSLSSGKKIKVYKIDINKLGMKKANKLAQNLYNRLKSGKKVENTEGINVIFDDVYIKGKTKLPEIIAKDIAKLSLSNKVLFIKDKNAYYLVLYEKNESIPMTIAQAKPEIEKILKEGKSKKLLNNILKEIKEKNLSFDEIIKKYNAKIQPLKEEKVLNLQFKYGLTQEDLDKLTKIKEGTYLSVLSNGKVIVFKVDKIVKPDKKELEKVRKSIMPMLENQKLNDLAMMLINRLKDGADVKINNRILQ